VTRNSYRRLSPLASWRPLKAWLTWPLADSLALSEGSGAGRCGGQPGFWDIKERYARLSETGDALERLNAVVPWKVFRTPLARAVGRRMIRC
jgi:hypothetical protein